MPPISPDEVPDKQIVSLPAEVFATFDELIVEAWDGRVAKVLQSVAVDKISAKLRCTRETVFNRGWLNIEAAYRSVGWVVEYDKPGYNETYEASFLFKKRSPA